MPIYEYRCSRGHTFEIACRVAQKRDTERCAQCGSVAKSVILTPRATEGMWFEGKVLPHVHDEMRFKNYREVEKHLAKTGDYLTSRTPAQLERLRESRNGKKTNRFSSKAKKFDFPDHVKRVMSQTSDLKKIEKAMKVG